MSDWQGDLKDDCFLHRYGYSAHVEKLGKKYWWFAIYRGKKDVYNSSNMKTLIKLKSGKAARAAAEHIIEIADRWGL